ncbi:alpha/beta hydrolase [Actinomadura chibensis]|uniref:Esterase n=1 Tax=Actinomadura chibensis TaxID=392828 RepID=A0A5D0NUL7_9ACTN|nr:alpha/beta hydrolase-fold protein [Actinomadura chibensis]TYB48085.1 esterase [Actinomadura chibensis]
MGLTSWGTFGLLALAAVGCMAAVVAVWPKAAAKRGRAVAARAAMLAGCQLVVVLALVAGLNAHYLFYGSWSDLFSAAGGGVGPPGTPAPNAGTTGGDGSRITVRTPRPDLSPGSRGDRSPAKDGQVERVVVQGVRTGLSAEEYVYLPPQYFQSAYASRRFPVVLFLAGYPAADRLVWIRRGHIPEDVAQAQAAHRIQPMIYVMARPTVVAGWDTECADVPGGPQVETFFAQDVPEAVAATYRVARDRSGWGVAGYSTGGFCAAKLAMLHSDRFSAGVTMAGHFHALLDTTTRDLYGGSPAVRRNSNLIWRERNLPPPPVSLLIASADVGEKTFPSARVFMRAARPPLTVDELLLPSGGHNFKTFRKYIPPSIRWLSARLRGE